MAYFTRPILTQKASEELAIAISSKLPIVFTRMSLGSGRHITNIANQTNTANHVLSITANQSLERTEEIRVMGRLDNRVVPSTISISEIGVFAKVGNRPEFMYLYTSSDEPDIVPSGTEASVIRDYTFNTRIDPSGTLTISYSIGEDVYAKYEEVIKVAQDLQAHIDNKNNPHNVTKQNVGLGNLTNDKQAKETDFNAHLQASNPHGITKETIKLDKVTNDKQAKEADFNTHLQAGNPHNITKTKVGLGNVDNYKTATLEEALAGESKNTFLTPFLGAQMFKGVVASGVGGTGNKQYWIQFSDGTQIIYGMIPPTRFNYNGADVYWDEDFAKPFVDIPIPANMGLLSNFVDGSYIWGSMGQVTATYNQNRLWKHKFRALITTYPNSENAILTAVFVGRWK